MRALVLAAVLLMSWPAAAAGQTAEPAIVVDARAFMESYARDLRAGDRAAISGRYDRSGAWIVNAGRAMFVPHDAVVQRYAGTDWVAPAAFEWRDLVFIPSGEDAVTVVGRFLWTPADSAAQLVSYHGQFVRRDGDLRILVEDETLVPAE